MLILRAAKVLIKNNKVVSSEILYNEISCVFCYKIENWPKGLYESVRTL